MEPRRRASLGQELSGSGVHTAHVAINALIGDTTVDGIEGVATVPADELAPHYWDLHERRDQTELDIGG